jgi:hypothetical protein
VYAWARAVCDCVWALPRRTRDRTARRGGVGAATVETIRILAMRIQRRVLLHEQSVYVHNCACTVYV